MIDEWCDANIGEANQEANQEAHLNMQQHHRVVQQICHFGSSPLLSLSPFQRFTKLSSFFPDFAAQQPLVACQLGSPGGLATWRHHAQAHTLYLPMLLCTFLNDCASYGQRFAHSMHPVTTSVHPSSLAQIELILKHTLDDSTWQAKQSLYMYFVLLLSE